MPLTGELFTRPMEPTSGICAYNEDAINLLHFMDIATHSIKMALDQTPKTKCKASQGELLQKGRSKRGGNSQNGKKKEGSGGPGKFVQKPLSQVVSESKSLSALFDVKNVAEPRSSQKYVATYFTRSESGDSSTSILKAPLKSRSLPSSFFIEPALRHKNRLPPSDLNPNPTTTSSHKPKPELHTTPSVGSDITMDNTSINNQCLVTVSPSLLLNVDMSSPEELPSISPISSPSPNYPLLPTDTLESILDYGVFSDILAETSGNDVEAAVCSTPCTNRVATGPDTPFSERSGMRISSHTSFVDSSPETLVTPPPGLSSVASCPSWPPCLFADVYTTNCGNINSISSSLSAYPMNVCACPKSCLSQFQHRCQRADQQGVYDGMYPCYSPPPPPNVQFPKQDYFGVDSFLGSADSYLTSPNFRESSSLFSNIANTCECRPIFNNSSRPLF